MFGTYRALLALAVVYLHFTDSALLPGHYAVFGFFILSGYLMTLIMAGSYGYTVRGVAIFGFNRFLRIFPTYWVACLAAVGILFIIDPDFTGHAANFFMPQNWIQWLRNVALIMHVETRPSLVQPAWTLTVELVYYVCIGFGLSRTRKLTLIWLFASAIYTLYMVLVGDDFTQRYFRVAAASLPFAIGASLFHWRDELSSRLDFLVTSASGPAIAISLFFLNGIAAYFLGGYEGFFFYLNIPICAVIVITLCQRKELPGISHGFDKLMGDISYPLYLIHAPLAWLLLYGCKLTGIPITGPSLPSFFLFVLPALLVAWLMSALVERPVDSIRARLKKQL